jgi:hypothetical protein
VGEGGDGADAGVDETGYEHDPVPCQAAADECQTAADCCVGAHASSLLEVDAATCPSTNYPNDWSCEPVTGPSGTYNRCVNAGCQTDEDCGRDLMASMRCVTIDNQSNKHCVKSCVDDTDCGPASLRLLCSGESNDTGFCQQDQLP